MRRIIGKKIRKYAECFLCIGTSRFKKLIGVIVAQARIYLRTFVKLSRNAASDAATIGATNKNANEPYIIVPSNRWLVGLKLVVGLVSGVNMNHKYNQRAATLKT